MAPVLPRPRALLAATAAGFFLAHVAISLRDFTRQAALQNPGASIRGSFSQQPTPPPPRTVDPNISFELGVRPRFLLKHLTKAGGTYAWWLLEQVLPELNRDLNNDDLDLGPITKQRHFVVAIVRNPCDWYISWAHFNSGKAFNYQHPTFGPNPFAKRTTGGHLSVDEFQSWYENVRFFTGEGFLSYNVWMHIVAPECIRCHIRIKKGEAWPFQEKCSNRTAMWEDWERWSPRSLAHCWIFHETFSEDLRRCLEAYESSSEFAKGVVQWGKFNEIVNASWQEAAFNDDKKSLAAQHKRHPPCGFYFGNTSGDREAQVRRSDPHLFQKFGYSGCCTQSSRQIW